MSVVKEDGFTVRVTTSAAVLSVSGADKTAWNVNGEGGDDVSDPDGNTFAVALTGEIDTGDAWSFTPPSGIVFAGGGDLPASSGTVG